MLWVYFQIRPCIAKPLSFLSRARLGCHRSQNNVCWKLVTLLFIKLDNWLPGYKSPWSARSRLGFRPILLKEMRFILSTKFQLSVLQLLLIGLYQNGRPRDWDFNHTRLRSRTWNSEILPIQCLYSKLRQSYVPFWQEVITVIVAQFPKLKLSRTLWGSGVQTYSVFSISCL